MALVGLAAGLVSVAAPGGQLSADPLAPARANAAACPAVCCRKPSSCTSGPFATRSSQHKLACWGTNSPAARRAHRPSGLGPSKPSRCCVKRLSCPTPTRYPPSVPGASRRLDLMEATDRATYLALTVGDISGTLDLLKSEQSQLARTVATSRRELQSAIEAESSAAQARLLALREAASLQVLLSRAESQVAALTSAERAPTGPPVGDGIVKALAQQLGATPANPRPTSIGASPGRAATAAVTAPLAVRTHKAASARKAALSNGPRTRATTTSELATTTRTTAVLRLTTTTLRPTTTTDGPTTTTGRPTTTTGPPTTRTGRRPPRPAEDRSRAPRRGPQPRRPPQQLVRSCRRPGPHPRRPRRRLQPLRRVQDNNVQDNNVQDNNVHDDDVHDNHFYDDHYRSPSTSHHAGDHHAGDHHAGDHHASDHHPASYDRRRNRRRSPAADRWPVARAARV